MQPSMRKDWRFVVSFLEGRGSLLSSLEFGMSEWKDEKVQSHSHHTPPCLGDSRDWPGPLSAWRRESDQLLAGPRTHALGRAHRWRRTSTSTRYSHYSTHNIFYTFSRLDVRGISAWKAWSRSSRFKIFMLCKMCKITFNLTTWTIVTQILFELYWSHLGIPWSWGDHHTACRGSHTGDSAPSTRYRH